MTCTSRIFHVIKYIKGEAMVDPLGINLDDVRKLIAKGLVSKVRKPDDQRRVGLHLQDEAARVLALAPGPFEGVLPQALQGLPSEVLAQLHQNLAQVVANLTDRDEQSAERPLSDL